MALVTEDGSGLANAESFASVAEATAYHAARGNASWAALDPTVQEQCLRRASDYMQQVYRTRWSGYLKTVTQALAWPRLSAIRRDLAPFPVYYANNIVPPEVKNACAELALKAATISLLPDLDRAKSKVSVGPVSVEYDLDSSELKRFISVDTMLTPLLQYGASGNNVRLSRV